MKKLLITLVFGLLLCSFITAVATSDAQAKKRVVDDDEDEADDEEDAEEANDDEVAVLYIPLLFRGDFTEKTVEKINTYFFRYLRKAQSYNIYTYNNLDEIVKSKKAVKAIKECQTKKGCLATAAKGTPLRLVVSGLFQMTDEEEVQAKLVVLDLSSKDIAQVEEHTFATVKKARNSKNIKKLVAKLLPDPAVMLGKSTKDDDEEEEEEEEVDASSGPKAKARVKPTVANKPKRFSSQQVAKQVRETLKLVVVARTGEAIDNLRQVKDTMRCECNEDGHATDVLLLLEEFVASEQNIQKAMDKKDSKEILSAADKLESSKAAIDKELEALGIKGVAVTNVELGQARSMGYLYKGQGERSAMNYSEAVKSWNKALEYNQANQEAAERLKDIPNMVTQLLAKSRATMTFDPASARKNINMVLELLPDENDQQHQDALDLLDELEDYEEE